MNEKMQMLFAHLICVAMIATCFWLSATVLADRPQLGQIVIGLGLFLWGKIGFRPSDAVVEGILETLTAKQVRKVVNSNPPAALAELLPLAPADQPPVAPFTRAGRTCERCDVPLSPFSTGSLCEACLASPPPRSAA